MSPMPWTSYAWMKQPHTLWGAMISQRSARPPTEPLPPFGPYWTQAGPVTIRKGSSRSVFVEPASCDTWSAPLSAPSFRWAAASSRLTNSLASSNRVIVLVQDPPHGPTASACTRLITPILQAASPWKTRYAVFMNSVACPDVIRYWPRLVRDGPFCFNNRQPARMVHPVRLRVALEGPWFRRLKPAAIHGMPLWGMERNNVTVFISVAKRNG